MTRRSPRRRRGVVLIMVLAVVVILSLAAYSFCDLMLSHHEGSQYAGRATQARLLVDSAVDMIRLTLSMDKQSQQDQGGLYDNYQLFQGIVVVPDEDPQFRGAFTVLAPQLDSEGYISSGVRYGLEDLSARLNLNYLVIADSLQEGAGRALLLTVPGMDEGTADAILDFLDPDDEPRELGAESEYYSGLGIQAKNGPLDSIEELLEVRDMTPQLLFGADWNRNGMIDLHESDMMATQPGLEAGWAPYLTLHSQEANRTSEGLPRAFVNGDDLQLLSDDLTAVGVPQDWITFIIAYRLAGPYTGNEEAEPATGALDLTAQPRQNISQLLDLVGAKVRVTFDGDSSATVLASPFQMDLGAMNIYFPLLMDKATVNPGAAIPGRININQASRAVLLGIPGITEEIVDAIIDLRSQDTDASNNLNMKFETWLLTEAVLIDEEGAPDMETMKALAPYICAGGDVYRAQVVGYFQEGGVASRTEVVIDATSPTITVLMWRDMSHLGRGFPIEVLGVDLGNAAMP